MVWGGGPETGLLTRFGDLGLAFLVNPLAITTVISFRCFDDDEVTSAVDWILLEERLCRFTIRPAVNAVNQRLASVLLAILSHENNFFWMGVFGVGGRCGNRGFLFGFHTPAMPGKAVPGFLPEFTGQIASTQDSFDLPVALVIPEAQGLGANQVLGVGGNLNARDLKQGLSCLVGRRKTPNKAVNRSTRSGVFK